MGINLQNDRILRSLRFQPLDRTPIWIMRQAGRYLPEYRKIREKAGDFLTLCKTPDLACEVTLQPLKRFELDAAIIFSDILTIPDAMGLGLEFSQGEGPVFNNPIRTEQQINNLPNLDPMQDLGYVMDAIKLTKRELAGKVPLIGFSGSPWTVATYMVEGKSSKNFSVIKSLLYKDPNKLHKLLNCLNNNIISYLKAQISSGADIVMIFDTWGGVLSLEDYKEFSLNYMKKIVAEIKKSNNNIPVILFSKNGGKALQDLSTSGCNGIGLDWTADLSKAKNILGDKKIALQGNLDPCVLYAAPEKIKFYVKKVLDQYNSYTNTGIKTGHIFNLGHGIHPDIPIENVQAMIEAVKEYSEVA